MNNHNQIVSRCNIEVYVLTRVSCSTLPDDLRLICAGGDEWLERKGKRSMPGPEQLRGRKNLFETFQQSSNPFVDGRTLDDIFLERRGRKPGRHESSAHMYKIIQDQDIQVAAAPSEVPRHYISELIPVDGSLTTRTIPAFKRA